MSVVVDCRKRNASVLFDDAFCDSLPSLSKRIRLSDSAALLASPISPPQSPLDLLRARFPDLDFELVQKVFETTGSNLDVAIKNLIELVSTSHGSQGKSEALLNDSVLIAPDVHLPSEGSMVGSASGMPNTTSNLPVDGPGWVELLLKELTSASDMNDAKICVSKILELFEKFVAARASHEPLESLCKENKNWKEQVEVLLHENNILKRAVAIQHERQKTFDAQNEEVQQLKQMLSQYKEQIRILEMNNYALGMHLKVAHQSSSIPGHPHPDVF